MKNKTFIIAEIGINHNGDTNLAKKMIDAAAEAGCDAVKFQKRTINTVYTTEELDQKRESPWGTTNRDQKNGLEFTKENYDEINKHCAEKDIAWLASAWDTESQLFLRQYNLDYNKIASAMLTHRELLETVAEEGKKTFISTGMSTLEEIDGAINIFKEHKCPFEPMHCVSTYPMDTKDANLYTIKTLRERYDCNVGYSGHETDVATSVAAVVLGATSLERHITLNRASYGSDQAASLETVGLNRLVRTIRSVENQLGDGVKRIIPAEEPVLAKLRRVNTL
jgi:N-acetylneuraminate synthase